MIRAFVYRPVLVFDLLTLLKKICIASLCLLVLLSVRVYALENDLSVVNESADKEDVDKDEAVEQKHQAPVYFNIWEYRIAGNALLQQSALERALIPYLGPDKLASVINDAADALEKLYRDMGFPTVFVDIPEQSVVDGIVLLQINESNISRLRVTGADYFTLSGLKKKVPSLQTGQTIHMPSVQADIKRLHSYSADLQAVPILKAGRIPGTMEIELRVKDELPLHANIELNNHYSANTTKQRLELGVSYDNLWQKFHSFKLLAQVSPEDTSEVRVLVANYIMPVNDDKNRLAVYAVKSSSDIAAVGGLSVIGEGNIIGTRYVIALESGKSLSHSTTLGLDYKDVKDSVNIGGGAALKTPIQYLVASASYSANVFAEEATMRYSAGVNLGLRGPNSSSEFDDKRFKANPDFIYFRGDISRSDNLPWGLTFVSNIKLQLTDSPLISNEQFTAGGYLSVRGYYESQVLGDNGVTGGVELYSPKLFHSDTSTHSIRFLTFFEAASVKTLEPLPGQLEHSQLVSAGAGLHVTKLKQLSIKIEWAYPLRDAGDAGSGTLVKKGDSRTVFSLAYAF